MSKVAHVTVETAIIMPIVLLFLIGVIDYGVYCHDKIICQMILDNITFMDIDNEASLSEDYLRQLVKGDKEVSIIKHIDAATPLFDSVTYHLEYAYQLWGNSHDIELSAKRTMMKPKNFIGFIDTIDDLTDHLSVTRDYKDKFDEQVRNLELFLAQ